MKKFKVVEIFDSIQGEGKFQGVPVTFIRLSGCTRKCSFCDTKYHTQYKEYTVDQLANYLNKRGKFIKVFTGGEPLLYIDLIKQLRTKIKKGCFHIETNGDLITDLTYIHVNMDGIFTYVCVSPKDLDTAKKVSRVMQHWCPSSWDSDYDIKVVTDIKKLNKELLPYATMLMPLTTHNKEDDTQIRQVVWDYCVENNLLYSARLHTTVWTTERQK